MKNATKHADDLRSLFKRLTKDCKPEPRQPPLDPLKALVRGAMTFDVPDARADEAMAVIDREFLRELPEIHPFVEAYVMLFAFDGHAVPVDDLTLAWLKGQGLIEESTGL